MTPAALADHISARASGGRGRFLVALAGPPGAGKSTLSEALVSALGSGARVVPMDGFHFDDAVLNAWGMRSRKGAPETFDVDGFIHLIKRLRVEERVAIPVFDRSMELSRAAADIVLPEDKYLIVEGNYLLLNEGRWAELAPMFDLTIWIDVSVEELDRRLVDRWAYYGKTPAEARAWIDGNDMPNIRRCIENSRPADVVIQP